jgi:Calcium-dependent channel, 7TM region, putative phosphate/Extracellular tail, of 10TM putative phosphate transporter
VYSVIAPLMSIFVLITFGLFWVVIKNNLLYCVRTGTVDGAGLFFPHAISQLFTGLYFMQICLIGLFFLVRDIDNKVACDAQGIIMAIVLVLTFLYHVWVMNHLGPLFKYAPVRLDVESNALLAEYEVKRLTEIKETQETATASKIDSRDDEKDNPNLSIDHTTTVQNSDNVQRPELRTVYRPGNIDSRNDQKDDSNLFVDHTTTIQNPDTVQRPELSTEHRPSFLQRQSNTASYRFQDIQVQQRKDVKSANRILARLNRPLDESRLAQLEKKLAQTETRLGNVLMLHRRDIEAQMMDDPISKIIMQHNDELENLDPEERDMLISIAFTHPVLRQSKPSVWIPKDVLGISDDEIRRTKELSEAVAIDNRGAYFDSRLKVQVDKPPPDMSEFALIMAEL